MLPVKPLNVLTLCASSTSECSTGRKAISQLLHKDRYTVYDISLSEFTESQWTESTIALVIPSPASGGPVNLASKALLHIRKFFFKGGKLLSFHPQVNAIFGFRLNSDISAPVNMLTFTHKTSFNPSTDTRDRTSAGDEVTCPLVPVKSSISKDDMIPLVGSTRQTLITVPSVGTVVELLQAQSTGGGTAVLSCVDLCPDLSALELNVLTSFKKTSEARMAVLSSMLSNLSLTCQPLVEVPLSWSYLLASKSVAKVLDLFNTKGDGGSYTVEVIERDEHGGVPVDCHPTDNKLCILSNPSPGELSGIKFNREEYFKELHTKSMGQAVLYTPVIASTQSLFTMKVPLVLALSNDIGFMSVAGRQTKGKGRGGNVWLSPEGCMMFSTSLHFPPTSSINSCVSILQHVMGTAVVHAVRTMDGYQDLDVRVKWPNDIYYMKNVKLGGTLVNCLSMGQEKVAIFGVGVNVTNDYPTLSLNDCINLHNIAHSANLKPISIEQLLARTLNVLEALIDDMEGVLLYGEMEDTLFMNLYYKYWLHSDPQNIVFLEKTGEYVTITGIDQYGYLVVWDRSNKQMTLQPDGNSFDLMKGLIKVKH